MLRPCVVAFCWRGLSVQAWPSTDLLTQSNSDKLGQQRDWQAAQPMPCAVRSVLPQTRALLLPNYGVARSGSSPRKRLESTVRAVDSLHHDYYHGKPDNRSSGPTAGSTHKAARIPERSKRSVVFAPQNRF